MKAILVIDKPKSCNECQLKYVHLRKDSWYCCLTNTEVEYECNMEIIDKNCPLKPMPEKIDIYERIYQAYGYGNDETYQRIRQEVEDIYDEILGEKDERND